MLQVERQIQIVDENYYSVNEALEILNISRATLYAKINTNELLSKKVDKRRFVYIDEEVKLKYLSDYFDDCSTEQSNHTTEQSDHTAKQSGHTTEHAEDGRLLDEIEYFKSKTIAFRIDWISGSNVPHCVWVSFSIINCKLIIALPELFVWKVIFSTKIGLDSALIW